MISGTPGRTPLNLQGELRGAGGAILDPRSLFVPFGGAAPQPGSRFPLRFLNPGAWFRKFPAGAADSVRSLEFRQAVISALGLRLQGNWGGKSGP